MDGGWVVGGWWMGEGWMDGCTVEGPSMSVGRQGVNDHRDDDVDTKHWAQEEAGRRAVAEVIRRQERIKEGFGGVSEATSKEGPVGNAKPCGPVGARSLCL